VSETAPKRPRFGCRLQELTEEVNTMPEAHHVSVMDPHLKPGLCPTSGSGLEGYKAPLIARVHLRLGMWLWTLHPVEVPLAAPATKQTCSRNYCIAAEGPGDSSQNRGCTVE